MKCYLNYEISNIAASVVMSPRTAFRSYETQLEYFIMCYLKSEFFL